VEHLVATMKTILLFVTLAMIPSCATAGQPIDGRFLIVGTPISYVVGTETEGEAQENLGSLPFYFRVRVDKLLLGPKESIFPNEFNLMLRLSDPDMVMKSQIVAVVDVERGELRLVHWGPVGKIACVPTAIIESAWRAKFTTSPFKHTKESLCTPIT
jgi:hypothetical protein